MSPDTWNLIDSLAGIVVLTVFTGYCALGAVHKRVDQWRHELDGDAFTRDAYKRSLHEPYPREEA
jgi:hypothetical protein